MRIGLYSILSTFLIIIIGLFVFTINSKYLSYTFGKGSESIIINLPIAVWIIIPMVLIMLASLFHMIYYGTKIFFKIKKLEEDAETLKYAFYWSILQEPKKYRFNNKAMKESASVLSISNLIIDGENKYISDEIKSLLSIIQRINGGEYIDLKIYKLNHKLSVNNSLVIKNSINFLHKNKNENENFIEEVLNHPKKYNIKVVEETLNIFSETNTLVKAKKYIKIFKKNHLFTLLSRVSSDNHLGLTKDLLNYFVSHLSSSLKCSDFMKISEITKKHFSPNENLSLFRTFESRYSPAKTAYLYLLFDYEMIDKAGDYLNDYDTQDFIRFRALYDLKKEHKKYRITDLMRTHQICNDS